MVFLPPFAIDVTFDQYYWQAALLAYLTEITQTQNGGQHVQRVEIVPGSSSIVREITHYLFAKTMETVHMCAREINLERPT